MEDDLDKKAWEIFRTALKFVELPEDITVNENEDGSISFLLKFSSENSGVGSFIYTPSIQHVKELLTLEKPEDSDIPDKLHEFLMQDDALAFAVLWIRNFPIELAECFYSLPDVPLFAFLITRQVMMEQRDKQTVASALRKKIDVNLYVKAIISEKIQRLKERIYDESKLFYRVNEPHKELFNFYYSDFYKKWKKAKECYDLNKGFDNRQKIVAVAFPELPPDLIECFDETSPNYDNYMATPSNIALKHAARMCGIDESLETRTLHNYLLASKKWAKSVGEEDVKKAIEHRHFHALRNLTIFFRLYLESGIEPPTECLTFYEKQLIKGYEDDYMKLITDFENTCWH